MVSVLQGVKSIPSAHIAPAKITGKHEYMIRPFHNSVIHGNLRNPGINFPQSFLLPGRSEAFGKLHQAVVNIRQKLLIIGQYGGCLPDEHAAVPCIAARFQISLRRFLIRLFHKFLHPAVRLSFRLHTADIAIACGREGRFNSDGHQGIRLLCRPYRSPERILKYRFFPDIGIRRDHTHDTVPIFFYNRHSRITDTGRRVPCRRFRKDMILTHTSRCLGKHDFRLRSIGDNKNIFLAGNAQKPVHRFIHKRLLPGKIQKLFRHLFRGKRPQPGAASARHYYSICFHKYHSSRKKILYLA